MSGGSSRDMFGYEVYGNDSVKSNCLETRRNLVCFE